MAHLNYGSVQESQYKTVRPLLQDGDIILVRGTKLWTNKLTKLRTNSGYYHTAIAFKMVACGDINRVMLVEQYTGGQRIIPLSTYDDYDVLRFPIRFDPVGRYLIDTSGSVQYSVGDYLSIGIREKFDIQMPDFNGEVCSEMVAKYLQKVGYDIPSLVSPQTIFEYYEDFLLYKVRPDNSFGDS